MASVYKQVDNSKFWIARFRMPDGRWVARSTKQTDRGNALRLAHEWEGVAVSAGELTPAGAAVGRVTREIIERATRCKIESVSIGDFLRQWTARMAATKAPGTARRYGDVIEGFLAHVGPDIQRRSLAAANTALVQGFIDAESALGKGAHTVSLAGKILHAAFKAGLRAGHLESNPTATLELPDFKMQEREEFTPGELEALLEEGQESEWETAILLGAHCGCRLGDAVTMRWENVDLTAARLSYVPQKTSRGSRRKTLEVPLTPRLQEHLDALAGRDEAQKSELLTPGLAGQRIGGRSGLSLAFRALMRRAGVEGKTTARAKNSAARSFSTKSFHSLRHFFVSQLRRSGADLEATKAAAGHSSDAMSARYDHGTRERVQRNLTAAMDKIPGARKG
ncbi:MAG TPA: site-specific integrase [Opitutales bacterium]|nr:site-specific integrase [Opitutales bacterium]